jgi:hypothetical protein
VLSTAKELVFLGYSLPAADLQAQFIFRCGFYNQLPGRLRKNGSGHAATGPSKVIIVNPEQDAARRIEAVAVPDIPCTWIPKRIQGCSTVKIADNTANIYPRQALKNAERLHMTSLSDIYPTTMQYQPHRDDEWRVVEPEL